MNGNDRRALSEFELIARYFRWPTSDPSVLIGSGDDAALLAPSENVALSTDTLVEGVHFLEGIDPGRLARRALAINLSDMAAMGARPRWFTLALTLSITDAQWLQKFAAGLRACAEQYDVALVGGDITAGPLSLCVTIAGEVAREQVLRRSGATSGDAVFVTGTPGDAAAGLQIARDLIADSDDTRYLLDRYELPTPRVSAGIALREFATAAIDVSDGLAGDLGRLCAASGCGAQVDVGTLPLSEALLAFAGRSDARRFALCGGDDYELCFTARPEAQADVLAALERVGVSAARIGECTSGSLVECRLDGDLFEVPQTGYEHFR